MDKIRIYKEKLPLPEEGIDLGLKRGICAFIEDNLEERVCNWPVFTL